MLSPSLMVTSVGSKLVASEVALAMRGTKMLWQDSVLSRHTQGPMRPSPTALTCSDSSRSTRTRKHSAPFGDQCCSWECKAWRSEGTAMTGCTSPRPLLVATLATFKPSSSGYGLVTRPWKSKICRGAEKCYLSQQKTIQNEIINLVGENIQALIVKDIKQGSGVFSVSADEVQNISLKEQLTVTVPYGDKRGTYFL